MRDSSFYIITSDLGTREWGGGGSWNVQMKRTVPAVSSRICSHTHMYLCKEKGKICYTHTPPQSSDRRQSMALFSVTIHHEYVWVVSLSRLRFIHPCNPFQLFFWTIVSKLQWSMLYGLYCALLFFNFPYLNLLCITIFAWPCVFTAHDIFVCPCHPGSQSVSKYLLNRSCLQQKLDEAEVEYLK